MNTQDFEKLKTRFLLEDVNEKISIYVSTEGLNTAQYKELLRIFPLENLSMLEKALA